MGLPYYLRHYSLHMEGRFGFNVFSLHITSRMTACTYMIDEFLAFLESLQDQRLWFDPWVRKIPWRRAWQPILVFLPGESRGQKNLVGYSPWAHKESDTTERLSTAQMTFMLTTEKRTILYPKAQSIHIAVLFLQL